MFGFGQFGRVRQRTRRLLAAAGVALLLGFQALSAACIVHDADHDCSGEECPVCAELHDCVSNFHLAGPAADSVPACQETAGTPEGAEPVAAVAPAPITLVSLKVRMDE